MYHKHRTRHAEALNVLVVITKKGAHVKQKMALCTLLQCGVGRSTPSTKESRS